MNSLNIKWILFFFMIWMLSCTKVIQVNLNDSSPQIVIEGNLTMGTGKYQVRISKSVNFSEANIFPPVSGAVVTITDSVSGITDSLSEISPGIYTGNLLTGIPGRAYGLFVLSGGQIYTSSSKMPQIVILDSVTFQHNNIFNRTAINPVVNFQDPPGVKNYYTFTQTVNSRDLKNTFVFNDRLSDGKYIRQQIFSDSTYIQVGDTVSVHMNCIDLGNFNYYNTLRNVTGGNNFNSVSPANPVSNISNNALGYFSAHTEQTVQTVAY